MKIDFILNRKNVTVNAEPEERLVDILRIAFGITTTKNGCGHGRCGSCLVYLDNDL